MTFRICRKRVIVSFCYLENDIELTTVGINFNTFISFLLSFVSAIIAIIMFFYNIYLAALFIGIDFIFLFYAIFNRKARFKTVLNKALIAYNSGAYEQCERYLNKAKAYNIEDKFIEIIECYLRKSRKTKSKYGYR